MKAILLLSALVLSHQSMALPGSIKQLIIDPPRAAQMTAFSIVTPNEGPDSSVQKPTLDDPFPGQAYIPPTTTEDTIVRTMKAAAHSEFENYEEDIGGEVDGEEEYDPADPETEAYLAAEDQEYEAQTGMSAYPTGKTVDNGNIDPAVLLGQGTSFEGLIHRTAGCVRGSCSLWIHVKKSSQTITVYVNGSPVGLPNNRTSTGGRGHTTPNFDKHPDGRIYTKYSSRKFPGGDWKGLGNMPYAVFISGGFALHGTPSIWSLGAPHSHGCIRLHPSTGKYINALVREYGVSDTWVTVN